VAWLRALSGESLPLILLTKLQDCGPTEIKVQLDRVTAALRQVVTYARQPERALEIAVRQTSRAAVQTAVSLLPSPLQLPVRFALRAVELALESAEISAARRKDVFDALRKSLKAFRSA